MTTIPTVCLLAGGLGSRLGSITKATPKAIVDVNGEPFLLHQLRELARQGVTRIVCCVGYLGELVEAAIGGERFGISITYSYDGPGLDGTLGAIRRASPLLDERFLVLYGDTLLVIDYLDAVDRWEGSGAPAFMSVLHNDGRWGASNAHCEDGFVAKYDKRNPSPEMSWIDYGLSGLSRELLERCPGASDLADLSTDLAVNHLLAAYPVNDRFYEIGSPAALDETRAYLAAKAASSQVDGAR